ncbi:MAG: CsiV family protein, partial [Woeseiaceae bacterium]
APPAEAIEPDLIEMPPLEWVLLEKSELTMTESYGRLERLQAYEPAMHFGWTQPTYEEDLTTSIPLHAFGRPPAALDGSLKLYLSRFLHLVVDLQLDAGAEQPTFYRINENRILRNGEVRYFDHPRFGVIAKVSRAEDVPDADLVELAGGGSQ